MNRTVAGSLTEAVWCPVCGEFAATLDLSERQRNDVEHVHYECLIEVDDLLTPLERRVIELLGEAFGAWVAAGVSGNDRREFVQAIHHAQHQVMAQAAARAYPDLYRVAEGTHP